MGTHLCCNFSFKVFRVSLLLICKNLGMFTSFVCVYQRYCSYCLTCIINKQCFRLSQFMGRKQTSYEVGMDQ